MGFKRDRCLEALLACVWDREAAKEHLLEGWVAQATTEHSLLAAILDQPSGDRRAHPRCRSGSWASWVAATSATKCRQAEGPGRKGKSPKGKPEPKVRKGGKRKKYDLAAVPA